MKKKILLIILALLVIIQFIRPSKNQSNEIAAADISHYYAVPDDVNTILKKACNDCHSNNTRYPWYSQVQPVGWWLNNHIEDGKEELNFNDFGNYRPAKQYHKLDKIIDEVKEGDMPLNSYLWIHTDAKLTDAEKQTLINWSEGIRDSMKVKYPADSLVMKRPPKKDND